MINSFTMILRSTVRRWFFKGSAVVLFVLLLLLSSCTRRLGYGILLWASEEPAIPSGTVLPVYIRSNIDQVWVAGIPKQYLSKDSKTDKFEIPLSKLELAGSKSKAEQRAREFAPYSMTYAETLQDGLPIRESPDNGARRVYRLKMGEIVKVLSPARGVEAVGTTGDALPGEWFKVLTEDGSTGYCFSYRLKLFQHEGGVLAAVSQDQAQAEDPDLEQILSRSWVAEAYGTMVNQRRVNLEELSQHWGFDPGQDTGIAHIRVKDLERTFSYTGIRSTGTRAWRFDGSPLQMNLRSDTTLAVQFTETGGALRTLLFVALAADVDDIILQETARRDGLYGFIYSQGPAYSSYNYGAITFAEDGSFTWTGCDLLVPQVIPAAALGSGTVDMRLVVGRELTELYTGAFTLRFDGVNGTAAEINFLYSMDAGSGAFRLEYAPDSSMNEIVVERRASSPLVLYFTRIESAGSTPQDSGLQDNTSNSGYDDYYNYNYDDYGDDEDWNEGADSYGGETEYY
jgi:hypothetical protein